ncbi:DnaD domain-containing protein [Clostridium coskatii]|uniref:Replication initiation and membrane attachment n=1 Tax=Clostridium coskatii TaxID=1705578 RepID=A0A162KQA3_9CLOT|nr:DnaD domain protein [Clostridium coskatii]OAA85402.1 Replication initiation and membrane attachment [Clostridium coskatii]OBR91376.1 replication initiation and membrane attachment [Clostridium coskatii]
MAKYRQLHTDFWNDGFVLDLTPEEKFFYIYLMTNSNTTQCGIYELPKRIIETQTGYNRETVDKLLLRFQEYKKIYYLDETKEIMILNWIKYNKPNNLNAVKCVNRELKNVKNKEFVSLFYKQCLNEELDIESIFDGIEIENFADSGNEDTELKEPLTSPLGGAYKELVSKEVISNKQKIINNKQEVRSNKSAGEETPFNTYSTVLAFFEENIHSAGEAEREKLRMWSGVIDCDVIILAVEEALKYNARNINYVGRILQSWRRKGLKTANDVKEYKNMRDHGGKCRQYNFKELERQLLGWGDG